MADTDFDTRVRTRAFQFLSEQTQLRGDDVLPRDVLAKGFEFEGRRVPLLGPQGIFKPAILPEMPLSITTVPVVEGEERPYDDGVGPDGFLRYRYRGRDPFHRDNQTLRLAMQRGVPLIYLIGIVPGRYMAVWPVYIRESNRDPTRDASAPLGGKIAPQSQTLIGGRAMVTVLTESGEWAVPAAEASREALWLPARDAGAATGYVVKPEGLCKGEVCVPVPPGRDREFVSGSRVNVAALWRHLGQPIVKSDRGHVWVLAESARDRAASLASLEAPDFTLPDASERLHSLSDHRGKKVLLVTWASW